MSELSLYDENDDPETGGLMTGDVDAEFAAIVAANGLEIPRPEGTFVEPFLVGRMTLKEIEVADTHRGLEPSTNKQITWTSKNDGTHGVKVDDVTYGDDD